MAKGSIQMTNELPLSILRYLKTIPTCSRAMAFLCLDNENIIVSTGGDLAKCGISALENGKLINEQLPVLVQLLPLCENSVVIANTQITEYTIIDLHLFADTAGQWIVMFDNTEQSLKLQSEQQERLSIDILEEKNQKSSGIV